MHCAKNIIGVDTRDWILSAGQLTEKKWRTCQLLRRDLCVLTLRRRIEKAANNEPTWVDWFAGQVGEKGMGWLWSAALLEIGTLGNDRGGRGELLPDNDNFVPSARRTVNKLSYSWKQGHKIWDKRIDTRSLSNIRAEYWRTPTWITVKASFAIDRLSLVWAWRYWVWLTVPFGLDILTSASCNWVDKSSLMLFSSAKARGRNLSVLTRSSSSEAIGTIGLMGVLTGIVVAPVTGVPVQYFDLEKIKFIESDHHIDCKFVIIFNDTSISLLYIFDILWDYALIRKKQKCIFENGFFFPQTLKIRVFRNSEIEKDSCTFMIIFWSHMIQLINDLE